MKKYVVDAFTSFPFKGNPAAVTIVDEFPSDESCLEIASELNLSETAFFKPLGGNRFNLRWFTPTVEVDLCGHATLAASHVLYTLKIIGAEASITFDTRSGTLRVTSNPERGITLDLPLQRCGEALNAELFATILGCPVTAAFQVS